MEEALFAYARQEKNEAARKCMWHGHVCQTVVAITGCNTAAWYWHARAVGAVFPKAV